VHALGGDTAAAWRAEGTTIVTAAVDTATLTDGVTRALEAVRGVTRPSHPHRLT
jgi:hypothetical protein